MTKLTRKTLIISSRVPPKIGGTPHQLSTLFADIDPTTYAVYTSPDSMEVKYHGRQLNCHYHFFPVRRITTPLEIYRTVRVCLKIITTEHIRVIYAPTDGGTSFLITLFVSWYSGIPFVLHFFDIYRGNNHSILRALQATILERLVVKRAETIIICNPAILAEYVRRYGDERRFFLIENSGPSAHPTLSHSSSPSTPPYRILYTGSIYWAQEESIIAMCEAVKTSVLPIEFHLYTPVPPERLKRRYANTPRIHFLEGNPEKMGDAQEQADLLFLPLSWPNESRIVTDTALPGKLPEYLLAGKPILILAPPECYLVRYATDEGFAVSVTELDSEYLRKTMEQVLGDTSCTQRLVQNAYRTYLKHHDATANRERFLRFLNAPH